MQHINRLFGFIVPLLSNFRSISLDCYRVALALVLAPFSNGRLHNLVVQAIRLEYQPFGHEDFGFDPRPQQLLGRHAVVAEESTGGERRSAQDAHPAYLLGANDGPQAKIKAHRRAKRQQ